jgi:hypothetical protein
MKFDLFLAQKISDRHRYLTNKSSFLMKKMSKALYNLFKAKKIYQFTRLHGT